MEKVFDFVYPDEPLKTTTKKNNIVKVTYYGPRYILLQLHYDDESISYASDDYNEVYNEMRMYDQDDYEYRILDAEEYPEIACFLTLEYENEEVPEFVEDLPDGTQWTHKYDESLINDVYRFESIKWDFNNDKPAEPKFERPDFSREDLRRQIEERKEEIKSALKNNNFSDEDRKKLEDFLNWLDNWEETFSDTDHWKINYPDDLPDY